jgi:hypothetical protein
MESKSDAIELQERQKEGTVETTERVGGEEHSLDDVPQVVDNRMNLTKWMACVALGLSYTTAIQQHSCTATIVKHIDIALGMLPSFGVAILGADNCRSDVVLQLDHIWS